jgi:hypothetical protein
MFLLERDAILFSKNLQSIFSNLTQKNLKQNKKNKLKKKVTIHTSLLTNLEIGNGHGNH